MNPSLLISSGVLVSIVKLDPAGTVNEILPVFFGAAAGCSMRAFSDCPNGRETHGRSGFYSRATTVCYSNADSRCFIKSSNSDPSSAGRRR